MTSRVSRRQFLGYGAGAGAGLAVLMTACRSGGGQSEPRADGDPPTTTNAFGYPEIEGAELLTDSSDFPKTFKERPEFVAMVEAGTLPPVADRIGRDPLVLRPVHEIGTYGGKLRRAFSAVSDRQNANMFCAGPDTLLYWDYRREQIIPNIARDFELSDDGTELTLHLRRDMRWSDGEPFTAEDIAFWRHDMSLNLELTSPPSSLQVNGEPVVVEIVDAATVSYRSPAPHALLPALLTRSELAGQAGNGGTGGGGFAPKHYLQQFHPAYVGEAEANRLAADAGFDGWVAFFRNRNSWELNPQLPTVTPWVVTRPINDPPWEFSANPYSIWVDAEGNQLPYIGEITMALAESPEVLVLRATSGDLDYQERGLTVASLPVLLENETRGGYRVGRHPSKQMDFGVRLNLAYVDDPVLGDLIRTTDFRRALSLGIDRDQINSSFFLDTSIPSATMCADDSPYFPGEEWRLKWATHEPDQANTLLDGIGLTARDSDGYRLRPDGSGRIRLDYQSSAGAFGNFPAMGEMIKSHWADIGIDMVVTELQGNLSVERAVANQLMLSGHQVGTDDPFVQSDVFLPTNTDNYPGMIGIPYALWFATNGARGVEPPPALDLLKQAMALRSQGLQATEDERIELGKQLYMLHADEVWSIGVVGFGLSAGAGVHCAKDTLGNVPARILSSAWLRSPNNAYPVTFYYR